MSSRELHWKIGDRDVLCRVERLRDQGAFHFGNEVLPFRLLDSAHVEIAGRRYRFYAVHDGATTIIWLDGHTYYLQRAGKTGVAHTAIPVGSNEIRALMPGKLLRITISVGDSVIQKQTVAIMESMKMESTLVTPVAGTVSEIRFNAGDVVEMGDVVVVIEPVQMSD